MKQFALNLYLNFKIFALLVLSTAGFLASCNQLPERVERLSGQELSIDLDSMETRVEIIDEGIVHVFVSRKGSVRRKESLTRIIKSPEESKFRVIQKGNEILVQTSRIEMKTSLETGATVFTDRNGKILLKEPRAPGIMNTTVTGDTGFQVRHWLEFSEDEALFGFGQHQNGIMNYRGKSVELYQQNMEVAIPVMISSKGYGIFWDHYCYSRFEDEHHGCFWSELVDGLNYYFIYGPESDGVVAGIRKLTGTAPMFPKWAYGFIQSRARYETQEEILGIVREYRKREVPLDVIVQDWQYWPDGWGAKEFDSLRYPDPKEMLDELHTDLHAHLLISVWPCFEKGSRDFEEMNKAGFLYPSNSRCYYDPFNPAASELYWKQAKRGLFDYGVDAWWADATEPEINGWDTGPDDYRKRMKPFLGSGARYMNAYSLMHTKGLYEGQRSVTKEKRVFILTRSAFTGQQRYAAATWSGDVSATWDVFRDQIAAGLNFSITGIPYWTSDIGAFFVNDKDWFRHGEFPGGVEDPEYREFFIRWYQFGAFCPLFRVHGAQTPREIWYFGEQGDPDYDIQVKYNRLRYRLMPYIYSLAGMVTLDDYTMMRPLVMDFPSDTEALNIDDQYMFGPAFMVCPVTVPGAISREVYLPVQPGGWYNFWTGNHFEGGQSIDAKADLETLPLFVRAGSILPMGPGMQYTSEKPEDPIELRIYTGADGKFLLYEDEGDNYNYENGQSSLIPLAWNAGEDKLTIENRRGDYNGKLKERSFRIVKVNDGTGVGLNPEQKHIEIKYLGNAYSLKLDAQ